MNAAGRRMARLVPASFRAPGGKALSYLALPNLALFVLVAVSLIGAVILIISTIDAERDERAQMRRTSDILLELRNVGHAAINAETGERGYFITLDKRYLAPYRLGREQYRPALDRLGRLIGNQATPRQRELLTEIDQLASAKFAEIDDSVGMIGRGELVAAQARFLSDEGQEVMDRLRRALNEMERIEQDILAQATARSAMAEARVLPMLGLLLVMLLGALGLGLRQAVQAARADAAEAYAAEVAEAR
ncbi:MAG: CHASE3 domain-containing protein, partial [Novosphingobium sp.]|nr:CHASE3 domain-containing protein [Novosphingobium sp.]